MAWFYQIFNTVELEKGLIKSDKTMPTSWNPLVSGDTYLQLTPFYRWQEISGDDLDTDLKTNGLKYQLFRDNTDFIPSPSLGSALLL